MGSRAPRLVLITVILLSLAGMACWALASAPPRYRTAHERWEQRQPRHYAMDATWHDGYGETHRAHIEVRDRVFIAGTNRATGRPLSAIELAAAANFVSVDALFETIAAASRPAADWRDQVARALPALAPWISPCVTPLPDARYDPALSYPSRLELRANPCTATFLYSADMNIRIEIERLQPLP